MRSIRFSLLVYFLGLLILAVGSASALVYSYSASTLSDKEKASSELIEQRFRLNTEDEDRRLNEALLEHALTLISRLDIRLNWQRMNYRSLHVLGAWTAQAMPGAHVSMMPWLIQGPHYANPAFMGPPSLASPAAREIWRSALADINVRPGTSGLVASGSGRPPESLELVGRTKGNSEVELKLPEHSPRVDYYQIDTNQWGKPLRSRSLGNRSFPSINDDFGGQDLFHWESDDFELTPGHWVRRLRLKSSSTQRIFSTNPRPPASARPSKGSPPPPPGRPSVSPPPEFSPGEPPRPRRYDPPFNVYVQVAADRQRLEKAITAHRQARDLELLAVQDDTVRSLRRLRNQLLFIISGTFLATILGSIGLVMLGLAPLQRLSESVSRISPRDFRLDIDQQQLPVELRPIVDRLGTTLDQLRRAFAREKQATADISHELRTPLAALRSTLELALRRPRSPEQYREMLQECLSSALHMNQIVERLLTLARLDAGVDRLRVQTFDVQQLAEQCAMGIRPLAEQQGLRLEVACHIDNSSPHEQRSLLQSDPDKLREILNNLLHNAVHYNRPDGRIDLSIARRGDRFKIEVRDTGIGISPQARERIFERFFRADPSRTVDGMNAGLGLAIVKEYIDLMGGRITVDSEEGRGSTFCIELPCTPPENRYPGEQSNSTSQQQGVSSVRRESQTTAAAFQA